MSIVERRSAPRYSVSLPGTAVTEAGHVSSIEVTNISSSGLQFLVNQAEIPELLPNMGQANTLSPVPILLNIELSSDDNLDIKPQPLEIKCGIVYVQRKSIELCMVGCRFEEFINNSDQRLEQYIQQHDKSSSLKLLNDESLI
ncbi:PilZ domain-containing protein [Aliikangiella coralliicola]|uniref:PilZ domain-containing protein n=1 Tax=Aliikangiella coralliicola TaxID=2592383 RepID=A0A545UG54_9GAMM|nr:PilZ domain-containing protein [Aliikangiella coralliicola]TQV88450.1 PilZ domain-containing protein [Aliikangiella coralliicola]